MIRLRADVTATVVVNPENWDSVGGLESAVEQSIRRVLGSIGQIPIVTVEASMLSEIDAQTLGIKS